MQTRKKYEMVLMSENILLCKHGWPVSLPVTPSTYILVCVIVSNYECKATGSGGYRYYEGLGLRVARVAPTTPPSTTPSVPLKAM